MRITSIDGVLNWPLKISCPYCKINIEVSMPTDLKIRREFKRKLIEDDFSYTLERSIVVVQCPICGRNHEIDKERIPHIILGKIPFDDIMPF